METTREGSPMAKSTTTWEGSRAAKSTATREGSPTEVSTETKIEIPREEAGKLLLDELELQEAENTLDELLGETNFSLIQAVKSLMQGEIPLDQEHLLKLLSDVLFKEVNNYRKTAVYLLILIIASAVFLNFMEVFDGRQMAGISYYMMYLLMVTLLMKVFISMSQVAQGAMAAVLAFMKALLPASAMTIFLTSGSLTAMGFYELTLLSITGVQWLFSSVLLPAVQIYVILLFINQMTKEDHISKLAELIKMVILWTIKTATAVLIGMQAIQCLIAPSVDQMKTSVLNRVVSVIPGIGNAYESVSEVMLGTALILKNAVGIAGVIALVLIGMIPVLKLVFGVLLYKALGAVAQPVTDKRVAECIGSVADGAELLLKILLSAGFLFLISLAMTAALIGGVR